MRTLLPISTVILLMVLGCAHCPTTESPVTATDYSVFTGGLHITNYSDDKPVVWVFSPYAPLRERVKGVSGFDTQSEIEDSKTMCLVVIRRRDGSYTEQTVTTSPIDLTRYIGKTRFAVSELVADLDRCLK